MNPKSPQPQTPTDKLYNQFFAPNANAVRTMQGTASFKIFSNIDYSVNIGISKDAEQKK